MADAATPRNATSPRAAEFVCPQSALPRSNFPRPSPRAHAAIAIAKRMPTRPDSLSGGSVGRRGSAARLQVHAGAIEFAGVSGGGDSVPIELRSPDDVRRDR